MAIENSKTRKKCFINKHQLNFSEKPFLVSLQTSLTVQTLYTNNPKLYQVPRLALQVLPTPLVHHPFTIETENIGF